MKHDPQLAETQAATTVVPEHADVMLDSLTVGVVKIRRDWTIEYFNRKGLELTAGSGVTIGRNHWDAFPSSTFEGSPWRRHYHLAMDEGIASSFTAYYPAPLDVWLRVDARPLPDGIVVFFSDVTAQHDAEAAAQRDRERLQSALDAAGDIGVWEWLPEADILYADAKVAAMFGLDAEQANRGVAVDVYRAAMHLDDRALFNAALTEAHRTRRARLTDLRVQPTASEVRWVSIHGQAVPQAPGEPERFVGVTLDITDRKRTEAALLQNEKLAAVGRLASSIAHEINNPLESVMNLLYLAQEDVSTADRRQYLQLADTELRRIAAIASQTLRFHRQSTSPRPMLANELCSSVLQLYASRLLNAGIRLERRDRATSSVICLEGEIRQVLHNLIGNAIDAMPGGGCLTVLAQNVNSPSTGRSGVAILVADTGSGMSETTREQIFQAFYSTKGNNGTGLGLWISAEIVARHGGRLQVRSSQHPERHGSVFRLFLPSEQHTEFAAAR